MKRKRRFIIIALIIILICIINYEKILYFYYLIINSSNNSKNSIEKEYNIQVTNMLYNKNEHLYEGIDNNTLIKKYIIVSSKGVFTFFADDGVDISNAQNIAEKNGFPCPPIYFCIKDSFTEEKKLEDYLYWYVVNDKGKIMYISFKDGTVYFDSLF